MLLCKCGLAGIPGFQVEEALGGKRVRDWVGVHWEGGLTLGGSPHDGLMGQPEGAGWQQPCGSPHLKSPRLQRRDPNPHYPPDYTP